MGTKKNIGKFILVILGILTFYSAYSQKNILSGFVVTLDKDTLHGFIDYRNWEKNPEKIYFRDKIDGEKIIYKPLEISSFSVLDEIYVSAIVQREVSPIKTNDLQAGQEVKLVIDTAFLQTVIRGPKSLYYYKDRDGKNQFYIGVDTTYDLLIYKRFLKKQDGVDIIGENNKYIGQLNLYFSDCPSIYSKINATKYNKKSIENLFLFYYNNCTQSEIEFKNAGKKTKVEIGLIAGVSLTSLKFHSDNFDYLVKVDYPQSVNFTGGIYFDVILPRNQGKWSINNELIFCSYNVEGTYKDIENENDYTIYYTNMGYSYIKMNNMVRYKYAINQWFIYLNVGISNGFALLEKNNLIKESKFYTMDRLENGKALEDSRRYEQGLILGLGTKFKRLSLEYRYEIANGMSSYNGLSSPTRRNFFLLGYKF